ncbi:DUF2975 domain-containing protein [Pedobacter ureilyticus]|jgi:hypothetical protein|uniref:DUF2975 domain-containing protein n=1 Tax=Pedobacter ureilyticus TaxID=1393051 RepID=A0ABW9J4B8_9SPHI|nr:DUF2975 domain-containing protein [Pedobacter helvus]
MKKIKILKVLVDISIVTLFMISVFFLAKLSPWMTKFDNFSDSLPQQESFDKLRLAFRFLPILLSLRAVIPLVFFIVLLFFIRKVLVSILKEAIFSLRQVKFIKTIATVYLVFSGILFLSNLLTAISYVSKNGSQVVFKAVLTTLSGSVGYLITSLVVYIIAEIFLVGAKLREENDLTI